MLKLVLFISILLLLVWRANCKEVEVVIETAHFPKKYIFLFGIILVVAIIRHVVRTFEIPVPYNIFSMTVGILWGYGALYSTWMSQMSNISVLILDNLYEFVLPPIIFTTGFSLDSHAFAKSLPQILIISIPVSLLASILNGLLMRQMLDINWSLHDAFIFGIISNSIYPMDVLRSLRETTIMSKYITILLEGETMVSSAVSICIFQILIYSAEGWLIYWYHYVMNILRIVVGGVFVGYLFGIGGGSLLKKVYSNSGNLMVLTLSLCYASFFVGDYVSNGAIISTMTTAILMSRQRSALAREVETIVSEFWRMICMTVVGAVFVAVGVETTVQFSQATLPINEYFFVFVMYLTSNITRLLCFSLFSPILSRTGYGMSFRNMIVCVWGALRSPLGVHLAWEFVQMEGQSVKGQHFFLHTIGLFVLMLLVNASFIPVLFKTIGLSVISTSRFINMNNCMKYVIEARGRQAAILKMDRLLSDANWPLVMTSTALRHPYKKSLMAEKKESENEERGGEEEEEDDYFMRYRFTYCPDCKKNIPNEPSNKELKEMVREAKMRLLKHKRTTYAREYENGMISKEGVRTLLQAVQFAMDSENLVIELDGLLEMFSAENPFHRFMRKRLQNIIKTKEEIYKPPRKRWRLLAFRILHNVLFNPIVNLIVVTNMIIITVHFNAKDMKETLLIYDLFVVSNIVFFFLYLGEFFLKILAYSWINIYQHGIKTYFSSGWDIIEFITLLVSFTSLLFHLVYVGTQKKPFRLWYIDLALNSFLGIRTCKVLLYLKLPALFRIIANHLIRHFSMEAEKNKATAYELGKNYIDGEDEILANIEQIIDNGKIREQLRKKTEADRLAVTRRLGVAQIDAPWVTTTVKTRTSIRTVLNGIKDDINELKVSGWVDDVEYTTLRNSLDEKYKEVSTIKYVEPSRPKLIFWEVPFMSDDEEVLQYLYKNVSTRKYDPGDTVINHGDIVEGIYIVITGLFRITFTPDKAITDKLKETGALPVIDYICSNTYDKEVLEYAMPGNTLGVLATLTDRRYDGTVSAETHSEVFLLRADVLRKAMMKDPDPVAGMECKIWKFVAFKKALHIMMKIPYYQSFSRDKMKYIVERSFIPNLSNYKIFVVNEMMQDILLIEGTAVDYNTRDVYTAPCPIPRAVQKLVLPQSSLVNLEGIEVKLMIIPAKDFDHYEIMITEEITSDLVDPNSPKCLKYYINEQQGRGKEVLQSSKMRSLTKQLRRTAMRVDSDKNKSLFSTSKTSKSSKASKVTLKSGSKYN